MIKCIFSARANFGCLNHSINFAACNLMRDAKTAQDQSLLKHIGRKIEFTGPITVHDYMRQVLTWPNQVTITKTYYHILVLLKSYRFFYMKKGILHDSRRVRSERAFHNVT